jgi:hypothetical protein
MKTRTFITANGQYIPVTKSSVDWWLLDTRIACADFLEIENLWLN